MLRKNAEKLVIKLGLVLIFCFSLSLAAADKINSDTALNNTEHPNSSSQVVTNEASAGIELAKILSATQTFQADFEQKVYQESDSGTQAESSLGHLIIKRPQQFIWKTIEPYEQTIIADGENLWTYDPELEQVTVQNQHKMLADSPILLLTSSIESLTDNFDVERIDSSDLKDVQKLFALNAKSSSMFETIHILIEGNKIKELFLVDTLGGRTIVTFNKARLNSHIDPNSFIFVPPADVDLIDSREVVPLEGTTQNDTATEKETQ